MADFVILPFSGVPISVLRQGEIGPDIDVSQFGSKMSMNCEGRFDAELGIFASQAPPPGPPPTASYAQIATFFGPNSLQQDDIVRSFLRVGVITVASPNLIPIVRIGMDFAPGPPGPAGLGAVLVWGNDAVGSGVGTRFLDPGRNGMAATVAMSSVIAPRTGVLRGFTARHNSASGNGNDVVYSVLVNGIATGLTVTLATGAIGSAADVINESPVLVGQRVDVIAFKALSIAGGGNVDVQCSVGIS